MKHLTLRVAWHDRSWDGAVCNSPSANAFCLALDRVREGRDDEYEDGVAGRFWRDLASDKIPPCQAEAGAFMNAYEWVRIIRHPYQNGIKTKATHGHLLPTPVTVPAYSTFAVPYWWMTTRNQDEIIEHSPAQWPEDQEAPFHTSWVFGRKRQEALLETFLLSLNLYGYKMGPISHIQ